MKKILFLCGKDGNEGAILTALMELDDTVNQSIESVILTHTHVLAGVMSRATLANDDIAGNALLTAKDFDA